MTARPVLIEAPQGALMSVPELRTLCRVDGPDHDARLEGAQRAAVELLDGYTGRLGRCILPQRWAVPLEGAADMVSLPFPQCRDFVVEARTGDQWAPVESAMVVPGNCGTVVAVTDMSEDVGAQRLAFWAGWDTPEDVPSNLVQAVGLLVAHLFDYDPRTWAGLQPGRLPMNVEAMISPLVVLA